MSVEKFSINFLKFSLPFCCIVKTLFFGNVVFLIEKYFNFCAFLNFTFRIGLNFVLFPDICKNFLQKIQKNLNFFLFHLSRFLDISLKFPLDFDIHFLIFLTSNLQNYSTCNTFSISNLSLPNYWYLITKICPTLSSIILSKKTIGINNSMN